MAEEGGSDNNYQLQYSKDWNSKNQEYAVADLNCTRDKEYLYQDISTAPSYSSVGVSSGSASPGTSTNPIVNFSRFCDYDYGIEDYGMGVNVSGVIAPGEELIKGNTTTSAPVLETTSSSIASAIVADGVEFVGDGISIVTTDMGLGSSAAADSSCGGDSLEEGRGSDSGLGPDLSSATTQDSVSSDDALPQAPQSWLERPKKPTLKRSALQNDLLCTGEKPPECKKSKKSIAFGDVKVFYFPRAQGFTCVPSQGGSTLGMVPKHTEARTLSVGEHANEQRRVHRSMLAASRTINPPGTVSPVPSSTSSSSDSDTDDLENQDVEHESDSCFFLQPVPTRQRRMMLRAAGINKIDSGEKDECRDIRSSREFCGCSCKGYCDPDSCSCSQAGIKCQVDRLNFPCGCTHDGCANSNGRLEFDPMRVRTHFIHTMMRLEMEKKQEEEGRSRAEQLYGHHHSHHHQTEYVYPPPPPPPQPSSSQQQQVAAVSSHLQHHHHHHHHAHSSLHHVSSSSSTTAAQQYQQSSNCYQNYDSRFLYGEYGSIYGAGGSDTPSISTDHLHHSQQPGGVVGLNGNYQDDYYRHYLPQHDGGVKSIADSILSPTTVIVPEHLHQQQATSSTYAVPSPPVVVSAQPPDEVSASSSTPPSSSLDNFGEIIKKTMVESVPA